MNDNFSFLKGWGQVKQKDAPKVQEALMEALSITTRQAFRLRMLGSIEPKMTEIHAIENVFKKYGITKIWGK